ncbi:MAG TPA: PilZ domain-containing protein [Thiotrichales bacterium]|nr:PilZ domain-containing protein [Thiotrichales bacterium]
MSASPHPLRRCFIRHPTAIPIQLSPLASPATPRMEDVSLGGLAALSPQPLPRGSEVEVIIPVGEPAFHARARVCWCRRLKDGAWRVGLQFCKGNDLFRLRMVEQLCHIEAYRRRVALREGRLLDRRQAAVEWIRREAERFPPLERIEGG